MGNDLKLLGSTCAENYQALIRHNAAVEGANTSVTPTEDFQLVLDRYFTTIHQPPFLIEYCMH